jgi:membrane associated rhomboid family serine protease
MGESDRYQEYRVKKTRFTLGQDNNALMGLVIINGIFLMVLLTVRAAYYFYEKTPAEFNVEVLPWFQVPGTFIKLSERPWTLITAMFSDLELFRIFSNMIWLWAFGSILQGISGNRKLIPIYIYGGLMGALFFVISYTFIPSLQIQQNVAGMMGANAAVMAIATATCVFTPKHRFFPMLGGGISIWVLLLLYLAIDYAGVAGSGAAFSLAHLGGAVAGGAFALLLKKGWDGSLWMNNLYDWFMNLFNPYKKEKNSVRDKVFYNTGKREPFSKTSNVTQQRVDEILDKINQKGYKFLTEEEKNFLRRASEE